MQKVFFLAITLVFLSSSVLADGNDDQDRPYIPSWQRANSPSFLTNNKAILCDLNLGRANGEVWYNPSETYGRVPNYDYVLLGVGPYWGDAYYNQTSGKFLYTQAWPALLNGQVVYRFQQVSAKVNPPTFTDSDHPVRGPQTYAVKWETPPTIEALGATQANFYQVTTSDVAIDLSITDKVTGKEVSNEQRTVQTCNVKRVYSQMLYLGYVPPGLTDDDLWSYWEAVIVQAPADIAACFNRFFTGQLPLAQDPNAPAGFAHSVYLCVPPPHARSMTADQFNAEYSAPIRSAAAATAAVAKLGY